MQTLDFTRALTEIVAELKIKELHTLMQGWLLDPLKPIANQAANQHLIPEDQKKTFASLLFNSHAGFDRLSRIDLTSRILNGMDARELYEPARLARIMNLVSSVQLMEQLRGSGNAELFDFFETLKAFLRMEVTCRTLLQDEKVGKVEPSDSLLELQLTDYDEGGVAPVRVAAVFSTLAKLQMNMARLLGAADNRLMVKYLDSGSDFKFGVEGLKEPIDAIRDLILSIWDRIKYRDQDTFERNMQAITAGLDLLEKTKQAVESKAVTQEEADILKELVLREANDLIGLGVSPPLKGPAADEERKRLISKRSTKLLTSGDASPAEPVPADPGPQQAK